MLLSLIGIVNSLFPGVPQAHNNIAYVLTYQSVSCQFVPTDLVSLSSGDLKKQSQLVAFRFLSCRKIYITISCTDKKLQ